MGTHLRVLSESFPMSTNVTGFRWFPQKNLCILVLRTKLASALEGLIKTFMCIPLDEEKNGYVARDQLLYAL